MGSFGSPCQHVKNFQTTHIKASANKKKYQKEQVRKAAKVYSGQLRREVNAEREKLGKKIDWGRG